MENYELIPFANPQALAEAAATAWLKTVEASTHQNRPHLVALSGGRIAREFFSAIVANARRAGVSLTQVHFFWADERCVPPDDPESNFNVASQSLFQPLGISPDHIHRIRGEIPPEQAAQEAAAELRRFTFAFAHGQPVLDAVFLGMGEDGHVASLFPDMPVGNTDSRETYLAVTATKPPPRRITLTFGVISAAKEVWVLASGPGKAEAFQKSLMLVSMKRRETVERAAKAGSLQKSLGLRGLTPLAHLLGMRQQTKIFSDIQAN